MNRGSGFDADFSNGEFAARIEDFRRKRGSTNRTVKPAGVLCASVMALLTAPSNKSAPLTDATRQPFSTLPVALDITTLPLRPPSSKPTGTGNPGNETMCSI
jgi:hypothetical protein